MPVLKPGHPRDPDFQAALRELGPDCCPVVAYGALLPQSALDIPEHGWVNLHFSVLPAWRGAAPVQHAIWAGDEVSGATTFRIVKELDAGPTYGLMTQTIRPGDTAGDLLQRLAEGGAGLLVQTLDGIEDGTLEAREQPADGVSFAPKITVEDAQVVWTEPAVAVDRRIRACTPDPGAWTTLDGERIKLGPVRPVGARAGSAGRPRAGSGACRQEGRPGRHRHHARPAGAGAGARPQGAGRRRLGPRQSGSSPAPASAPSSVAPMAARASTPRARPDDVDDICRGLPETTFGTSWGDVPDLAGADGGQGSRVRALPQAAQERDRPRATGEEYDDLLVIRTANPDDKLALVEGNGPFFTIDHFNGFNAVLVQLSRLGELIARGAGRGDHRRMARQWRRRSWSASSSDDPGRRGEGAPACLGRRGAAGGVRRAGGRATGRRLRQPRPAAAPPGAPDRGS